MTDDEVLERVRAGETALYGIFAHRYHRRLYSVARRILKSDSEAEDAVQETHLRVLKHLHQFAGRSSFLSWLTRITVNEALTRIRRRVPYESLESDRLVSQARNPEQQVLDQQLRRVLRVSLEALPAEYRSVLAMREIREMTTAETAARLGISDECVKSRAHRARALLRRKAYRHLQPAGGQSRTV